LQLSGADIRKSIAGIRTCTQKNLWLKVHNANHYTTAPSTL
jgi:hypothetical protein